MENLLFPDGAENFGQFLKDPPKVALLVDGRSLELLDDFEFKDPQDAIWTAKKGSRVDGASIPRALWTLIGGPLEGPYRNASIIHDYYCDHHERDWRATHLVFYYGMRAGGVAELKAKLMYYAVVLCGPRWGQAPTEASFSVQEYRGDVSTSGGPDNTRFVSVKPQVGQQELAKAHQMQTRLEQGEEISVRELERLAIAHSQQEFPTFLQV